MTIGTVLGRRRLVAGLLAAGPLGALAAACTPAAPQVNVTQPANAPATDRVTRLLLWLPPNSTVIDSPKLAASLSAKLALQGVQVEAVLARPLELDRDDAQRPFIARFHPSHRLDIDFRMASSSSVSGGGSLVMVSITGQLYTATVTTPIRRFVFTTSGRIAATQEAANKFSDDLMAKLQATGIAFGW